MTDLIITEAAAEPVALIAGQGPKGDPGPAGGPPGPKGDKGDTGATSTEPGPKGDKGDTGAASTVPGPKGDTGDTGAASTVPGPKGDTGAASTTPGPKGDKGDKGDTGPGVAPGGTTGQLLAKASATDYATTWTDPPTGGGGGAATDGPIWAGAAGGTIAATGYSAALITPASMAQTTDLPSASAPAVTGKQLAVRNVSPQYSLLLRAQAGQTIDGLTQRYIMPSGSLLLRSDGANWACMSNPHPPGTVLGRYTRTSITAANFANPVDFDAPTYVPVPGLQVATPTPRFIPPEPGWYRVHGHLTAPGFTSGALVKTFLRKNDADVAIYAQTAPPSGWWATPAVDDTVYCSGTDYIQFFVGTTGSVRSDLSVVMFSYA